MHQRTRVPFLGSKPNGAFISNGEIVRYLGKRLSAQFPNCINRGDPI